MTKEDIRKQLRRVGSADRHHCYVRIVVHEAFRESRPPRGEEAAFQVEAAVPHEGGGHIRQGILDDPVPYDQAVNYAVDWLISMP